MGGCFSTSTSTSVAGDSVSNSNSSSSCCALVISSTGELRPYSAPAFVSDVVQNETEGYFVCNSDSLCYDQHISPLDAHQQLHIGQIYFVLPLSRLRYPLTASEMAALAVKASVALNSKSKSKSKSTSKGGKNDRSKITPFVIVNDKEEGKSGSEIIKYDENHQRVSRSGSIRRRKMTMRSRLSFRLRLSTIYETDHSHSHSHSHNN
ncbi:hypothetical protein E3N88_11674 [Mikania micrantha]|uniref:DUF4228 domain-containing protein n=1 Tax=Mikania micrantha TaxID=192012 RepID=A0A5N6P6F0_9ASTR|nr:hypothetical protein E3N88_11674 [Mikania micrantha]